MTRFLYLIVRFIEITLTGLAALGIVAVSLWTTFLILSDGAPPLALLFGAAIALLSVGLGIWLFIRRIRVAGRDELFGQTGIDLSERAYVLCAAIVIVVFVCFVVWLFSQGETAATPAPEANARAAAYSDGPLH